MTSKLLSIITTFTWIEISMIISKSLKRSIYSKTLVKLSGLPMRWRINMSLILDMIRNKTIHKYHIISFKKRRSRKIQREANKWLKSTVTLEIYLMTIKTRYSLHVKHFWRKLLETSSFGQDRFFSSLELRSNIFVFSCKNDRTY